MTYQHIKKPIKRILYELRKNPNRETGDLCFGHMDKFKQVVMTMQRLKKKGLVFQDRIPLKSESNKIAVRAFYWLTPEGIKVADEIAKEVDEYKKW